MSCLCLIWLWWSRALFDLSRCARDICLNSFSVPPSLRRRLLLKTKCCGFYFTSSFFFFDFLMNCQNFCLMKWLCCCYYNVVQSFKYVFMGFHYINVVVFVIMSTTWACNQQFCYNIWFDKWIIWYKDKRMNGDSFLRVHIIFSFHLVIKDHQNYRI